MLYRVILFILLFTSSPSLWAQYYQNLTTTHPKAMGLANAVTADPPGLASAHFNPAGLHRVTDEADIYELHLVMPQTPTFVFETQWTGEYPDNTLTFLGCDVECVLENPDDTSVQRYEVEDFYTNLPGSGKKRTSKAVPLGGIALRWLEHDLTFATSTYVLFQSGYEIPAGQPGEFPRFGSASSDIVLLSPSVATSIGENIQVGISFPIHYYGFDFDSKIRLPNLVLGFANEALETLCNVTDPLEICVEDGATLPLYSELVTFQIETKDKITPSVNIGILWDATPWLTFGAVYQSEIKHKAKGDFWITYDEGINNLLNTGLVNLLPGTPNDYDGSGKESGELVYKETMPAHYSVGVSIKVLPNLKLNIDHKTTKFSVWQDQKFYLDRETYLSAIMGLLNDGEKPNTVISGRSFEDGENLAFGLEYQWDDQWTIRLGYEHRDSVIAPQNRSFSFPLGNTTVKGFGLSYRLSHLQSIDFGYTNTYSEQYIPSGSSVATTWDPGEINAAYPGYNLRNKIEIDMLVLSYTSDW